MHDEIADGLGVVADDVKVFAEVDRLDDVVDDERLTMRPTKEKRPVLMSKTKQADFNSYC